MLTEKKSLLCCFLAALILLFSSLPCVTAQDIPDPEQAMRSYIGSSFDQTNFRIAGQTKGAAVCTYFDKKEYDQNKGFVAAERLGDYIFTCSPCFRLQGIPYNAEPEIFSRYDIGIFIVKDGKVTNLRTAYENGVIDMKEVAAMQFTGYDLTVGNITGALTPREAICARYFDEFNSPYSCPIFLYREEKEQFEGYTLCSFWATDRGFYHPAFHVMTSCGYLMQAPGLAPYQPAVFAVKDGSVYTFEEAYNQGIFSDIDALAKQYDMQKIGDCDNDRQITVKDALYVQKYLANIVPLPDVYSYGAECILDFNGDGKTGMLDVIAMQKEIAKAP